MNFVKTVFMWIGFLTLYVGIAVGIGKLFKRGRINAFGPDPEDEVWESQKGRLVHDYLDIVPSIGGIVDDETDIPPR